MRALVALLVMFAVPSALAHVGSKDVFETVHAGPYQLFVTIRPPTVIPGVATVELRAPGTTAVDITPMPLTGEASLHPPAPDGMTRSTYDPAFFTGSVWMMSAGSWQVRFDVDGPAGRRSAAVPVPAVALSTLTMQPAMGLILSLLGLFLVVTMAGLIAAAVREARLPSGLVPDAVRRRRALIAAPASLAVMALMIYGGAKWWKVEAASYAGKIYHPLATTAQLSDDTLDLLVQPIAPDTENRQPGRSNTDFLPDHGRLMHLYAIRQPQMDAAFHLHPSLVAPGDFRLALPKMPPGEYALYGDVVHASGFPETLVARVQVPAGLAGGSLGEEDAEALPPPLASSPLGTTFRMPDGYSMVWDRPTSLTASHAYTFTFHLLAPDGTPAADIQPYLGMAGHAAFVKTDGTVFAHTHPEGSVPMASLDLANGAMAPMPAKLSATVGFPYGFPEAGSYRIFIQMKHGGTVETGVFDVSVGS